VHPSVIADGIFVRLYKSPQCLAMPDRSPDISLLCNLEFPPQGCHLADIPDTGCRGRVRMLYHQFTSLIHSQGFGYFTVIDSSLPDTLLIVGGFFIISILISLLTNFVLMALTGVVFFSPLKL
jgi:hypothetical protein